MKHYVKSYSRIHELYLTEVEAIALYAGASDDDTRAWLEEKLNHVGGFVERATLVEEEAPKPLELGNDVPKAARELYFYERSSLLSALL
eukprot:14646706-Ditylum_brightwellii.AAC.1